MPLLLPGSLTLTSKVSIQSFEHIYTVFFYNNNKKKKQKIFGILKKRKERILGVHNLDLSVKIHTQSIKGYDEKTRTGRQK